MEDYTDREMTDISPENRLADLSLWGLIAGNVFSIIMAAIQGWDIGQIIWVYWMQSVIIGIINYIRIRSLKEFSTKGLKINGKSVEPTVQTRNSTAIFFMIHYGMFHLFYALFLSVGLLQSPIDMSEFPFILLCAICFLGSHGYSFAHNVKRDFKQKKPNIGTIMFYPYLRIIPMHIAIICGASMGVGWTLYLFLVLKTLADAGMHMVEHHLFQKPDKTLLYKDVIASPFPETTERTDEGE